MTNSQRKMTPEVKQRLSRSQGQTASVRRYLEAIDAMRAMPSKSEAKEMRARLAEIAVDIEGATGIAMLRLVQEQITLRESLRFEQVNNLQELEAAFVAHARSYGERRGISFEAWATVGVDTHVLERAGIER